MPAETDVKGGAGAAEGVDQSQPSEDRARLQFRIAATPLGVRGALRWIVANQGQMSLTEESRGSVEVALAEVLNNIVEHAYAEAGDGAIELSLVYTDDNLVCDVWDDGREMPGRRLPHGQRASPEEAAALPEGGFGWGLIRELTEELSYAREAGRNHLRFRVPVTHRD